MSLFDKNIWLLKQMRRDATPRCRSPLPHAVNEHSMTNVPLLDGDRLLRYGLLLGRRTFILAIARRI